MFVTLMLDAIRRYRLERRTMRELGGLDDRQLADIGITRAQIRSVSAVMSQA